MKRTLIFILVIFTISLYAQPVENQSVLTIEQVMQGEKFVGYSPSGLFWSQDSQTAYFSWNPEMDTLNSMYKVSVDGGPPEKVGLEDEMALPSRFGTYSKDFRYYLYPQNGDLFLLDNNSGTTTQITNTLDRESNPVFSGDESAVIFTKSNNLYAWNRSSGVMEQLTQFREGSERSSSSRSPEQKAWLEEQQMELFEILQERKAVRELRQARNETMQVDRPLEIYYGGSSISDLQISPDMRFVTYRLTDQASADRTKVPNFVTESGYLEDLRSRPKVGSPQNTYRTGVYDRQRDTFYLIDTEQIEGIFQKPAFLKEYHEGDEPFEEKYEDPREVVLFGPVYSEDGKAVVVVRSQDNKDRWIMLLDLPTGELKLLDRQHDEAWIGGPGISSWNFSAGNIGWLADNKTLWFQSEETGYSHLYTLDVETGRKKALTSGKFEIRDAQLSRDKTKFFVSSNAESPHELHFYTLPVSGGDMEKITSMEGGNQVTMSPDEQYLAIRYSYSNKPWELYIMKNEPGAPATQVTNSTTAAFNNYSWKDPQIVYFTARDGAQVPARLYRPERPRRNGPAVIFVHGAGYLQNVHKWWSSYYREYMFHNILVDNGYTVLDIDYRASDGYGRDWRTGIYRHMGGKDLSDQVDGAKFLVEEYRVDPDRIGIYGGSYGGFITLMALFTSPGTFEAGAALRSVTDWAHYNHGYTANILNTPVEDPIAYKRSSPIYFAENLEDHLLILHGMIDTNVQFQDVVRLAQRLIELGKDNWEFAVFPVEGHGFREPTSWSDEYKRIFNLFQTRLKR
jgi:dipeptidyl aminopeptidase/acylaminoacyl peptidase